MTLPEAAALAASALAAGIINAVAGGGTVLTFPALVLTGTPPVIANATSCVALTAGTAGSVFGFRRQWGEVRDRLRTFGPVSVLGGLGGAVLLTAGKPEVFARIVPWLLLFATVLFLIQAPLRRLVLGRTARPDASAVGRSGFSPAACAALQLGVAIYGGYFGAGIGILMLAVLGFLGLTDIHVMNALKNVLASLINATASVWFVANGAVDWPRAGVLFCGAIAGYWLGAHYSQKIPQPVVRGLVVAVGLAISAVLFIRMAS